MARDARKLIRVELPGQDSESTSDLINRLMGKNPETRFKFITDNAKFVEELDI